MRFVISKIDIRDSVHHGEHYPVIVNFDSTDTVIVLGEDGREYKLFQHQYTTEQEQRIKYNLGTMQMHGQLAS